MLENILENGLEKLKLNYDERTIKRFRIYYEFLAERNSVMNLTAIVGEEDTAILHFLDCAQLIKILDSSSCSLIDVGTGAGFPGLVIKILRPDIKLTLLDSQEKRVKFLKETCEKLEFDDVDCLHIRAEEAPIEMRESFDIATSRAVARLNALCELCMPFVRPGGQFIAMKGPQYTTELDEAKNAIRVLGGRYERTEEYSVAGTDVSHAAVIIKKTGTTSAKYPRRWAQIKSKPL